MTNEKAIWRKGARFTKIDPDLAHAEMESIRIEKGQLTADLLLEKARDGSNVLHSAFEWRDGIAAEQYRLGQARQMIKSIEIVYEDVPVEETTVKYWHIVKDEEEEEPIKSYVPKDQALADPEMRAKMVLGAYKELRNFRKKYKELDELAQFHDLIDSLVPD